MPQLRDFLSRFRPAGAPGAAARAGVPVDRASELAAEVTPVLALLDGTHAECEQLREQARHDADGILAAARAEAAAIAADGERRARAARTEAARQVTDAAASDATAMLTDAQRQADQVRTRARHRMPALVAQATGGLRRLLTEDR